MYDYVELCTYFHAQNHFLTGYCRRSLFGARECRVGQRFRARVDRAQRSHERQFQRYVG